MADKPNTETKKRRLRAPAETLRELNEKSRMSAEQPPVVGRGKSFFSGFFWPLRMLGQLLGRVGRFLGRFRVFRFIGAILLPRYFRNSWRELRLVTWPGRRRSLELTWAVIVFSVVFGLIVAGVDFVLEKIFKQLILG